MAVQQYVMATYKRLAMQELLFAKELKSELGVLAVSPLRAFPCVPQ